jgi:hypothetical protein
MEAIRTIEKADHFRQEAKYCLEVAERKPVGDRACLLEMAQHWLHMATKAEAAATHPDASGESRRNSEADCRL